VLKVEVLRDKGGLERLREPWSALLPRSASDVPTVAPGWIFPWIDAFGDGVEIRALALFDGTRLVGLAPLGARRRPHRLGFRVRSLELLATGEDEADEIASDYVGVVAERGVEAQVADAVVKALAEAGDWDELMMERMSGDSPMPLLLADALRQAGYVVDLAVTGFAPYVALPRSWEDYLAALPASRRYFIRRTLRDFDAWAGGVARVSLAQTDKEAAEALGILAALHGERWKEAGKGGAFASEKFLAFHRAVLPGLREAGALGLRWLSVRGEPIAAHYEIMWHGKVHFYQSGRKTRLPRGIRPGIVMHAHAIQCAIDGGLSEYDFLAGDARYKLELATATRPLVRLRASRPTVGSVARRVLDLAEDEVRALSKRVKLPTAASMQSP
jgi:CelD/BcsL family acetyltransferase involved in cellulose biosynthesis